ncbi:MAG: acyl carrier protein [Fibromonadales bacterium]|nr:acyl carrier protein [Fibromonadales bacterium]
MDSIQEKLFEIIAKSLNISSSQVNEELRIGSIPEWDSLAHLNLISEIESAFATQLDVGKLLYAEKVGDLLNIVKKG